MSLTTEKWRCRKEAEMTLKRLSAAAAAESLSVFSAGDSRALSTRYFFYLFFLQFNDLLQSLFFFFSASQPSLPAERGAY